MTTVKKSSWDTVEGLPDDFDFWITGAQFGFREEYQSGQTLLLIWEGESPDVETTSIIWPIGGDWEVLENGRRVKHPKRDAFVKSSMYGRLITRVVKELRVNMEARGLATDADVWKGLGFHVKRETIQYGAGILEDKGGKTEHLMPVSFLGDRSAKKAETTAGRGVLERRLAILAGKLPKKEFMEKVIEIDEVSSDADLLELTLDESPKGFWATHQK